MLGHTQNVYQPYSWADYFSVEVKFIFETILWKI